MFSGGKESNGTIVNTVRRNRKSEIQDGGLQSGNTYISPCGHDSNNILRVIPMILGSSNSIGLLEILCDLVGIWKSNMAAHKPKVSISQLVDKSWIIFKELYLYFWGRAVHFSQFHDNSLKTIKMTLQELVSCSATMHSTVSDSKVNKHDNHCRMITKAYWVNYLNLS